MERMKNDSYKPEAFVEGLSQGAELAPQLFRKLKIVSKLLDEATELEHFQSIGVQCRETLIELANEIYEPEMCDEEEQPKGSDFKKKSELFIKYYLNGPDNSDYRTYIKKMAEATWDYANKITHSSSATIYEASTCVTLCISIITVYENIRTKYFDPFSKLSCSNCKSKSLTVIGDKTNVEDILTEVTFQCQECQNIMSIKL